MRRMFEISVIRNPPIPTEREIAITAVLPRSVLVSSPRPRVPTDGRVATEVAPEEQKQDKY